MEPDLLQRVFSGSWTGADRAWRVVVVSVLLQRTRGQTAIPVLRELFGRWPAAEQMAEAPVGQIRRVIRPLGLEMNRARWLRTISDAFLERRSQEVPPLEFVRDLPGVGPYTLAAYRLVVLGDLDVETDDWALRRWRDWARTKEGDR